jgi:hypothetical protein
MIHDRLGRFSVMVGLLLLAACTLRADDSITLDREQTSSGIGDPEIDATEAQEEPDPTQHQNEPPPAWLTIDGASQESGIGTYCWNESGSLVTCADKLGIPTQPTALKATPLAFLQFELALEEDPSFVDLAVTSVVETDVIPSDTGSWIWWEINRLGGRFSLALVSDPQIELTLEPGLNVLALTVGWPEKGDVTYGFLVDVVAE